MEEIIGQQIANPNDAWELSHYRTRIGTYYGADEDLALAVLDAVAASSASISLAEIFRPAGTAIPQLKKEHLRSLLHLLEKDHYLSRAGSKYAFAFPLNRRWWRLDRGLD